MANQHFEMWWYFSMSQTNCNRELHANTYCRHTVTCRDAWIMCWPSYWRSSDSSLHFSTYPSLQNFKKVHGLMIWPNILQATWCTLVSVVFVLPVPHIVPSFTLASRYGTALQELPVPSWVVDDRFGGWGSWENLQRQPGSSSGAFFAANDAARNKLLGTFEAPDTPVKFSGKLLGGGRWLGQIGSYRHFHIKMLADFSGWLYDSQPLEEFSGLSAVPLSESPKMPSRCLITSFNRPWAHHLRWLKDRTVRHRDKHFKSQRFQKSQPHIERNCCLIATSTETFLASLVVPRL